MSELVPPQAICLLYRRYIKAAVRIPNTTIRMLLLQQIKNGFRRNQSIQSALAQRELISQSHKDLAIIEDDRHQRTLYINRFGVVSCLEWEVRRTEWFLSPKGSNAYLALIFVSMSMIIHVITHTKVAEDAAPHISKQVDQMAMRLECENPDDLWKVREQNMANSVSALQHQRELEHRILATFKDAPEPVALPNMQNPSGSGREASKLRTRNEHLNQPPAVPS